MAETQKTDDTAGAAQDGERTAPITEEHKPSVKTMRELERLQFDELDRAAFDKR